MSQKHATFPLGAKKYLRPEVFEPLMNEGKGVDVSKTLFKIDRKMKVGEFMNIDLDRLDRKPMVKKIVKYVLIWVVQIALVIFLAYLLITYGVEKMTISGDSMSTTLIEGDSVLINKLSYRFTDPDRFDIIVFKQHGKEHSFYNVKRVIGLPGETVQIKEGIVYINGDAITEVSNVELMDNGGLANEPVVLEENEYFVLGDSRNTSEDSRFATIGNIVRDDIVGKAWFDLGNLAFVDSKNLVEEVEPTATAKSTTK